MQKILNYTFCCLFLALAVVACSPVIEQRGNMLEDYQISEIKAGQHTRSDVLRLLGSPTTQSTFNPDKWYYMGQQTEKRGILDREVKAERITIVEFDKEGVVSYIGDADGHRLDVPIAKSQTPTHGNELTFMQQLLGNVGRFNAPQASATDKR